MRFARLVFLGLLALLVPVSSYANYNYIPKNIHAWPWHKSRQKHSTLSSPYSVGGKHAKHNTYKYLGAKNKHHKNNRPKNSKQHRP
jgi:hypothetical protein